MTEIFQGLHPVFQALIATCFTYAMTASGASLVFLSKDISRKLLDGMLGFSSGAMIFVVIEELVPESQR